MSGFMSAYDSTRRITIPHPDTEYWVDLREHISLAAKDAADRLLANGKRVLDPRTNDVTVTQDMVAWRHALVLAHIKAWNLDDEQGRVWPVDAVHVKKLPSTVFDLLFQEVDELAAPLTREEQRRFPDVGVGGDPDGDAGASVAADAAAADGAA